MTEFYFCFLNHYKMEVYCAVKHSTTGILSVDDK